MMSRPVIGRPVKDKAEEDFKKCILKNLNRNMLQCKILEQVYINFVNKDFQQLTSSQVEGIFRSNGLIDYYRRLFNIKAITSTTVSGKDIEKYTSKKDILYILHLIVSEQNQPRIITIKQLYFLLIFYLYMNELLDRAVYRFMLENMTQFMDLARHGPKEGMEINKNPGLVEHLVRWGLELATLEELSIAFEYS